MASEAERRLAIAVLSLALADLRWPQPKGGQTDRDGRRNKALAALWLASRAARLWFDLAGVDQEWALERAGWRRLATAALEVAQDDDIRLALEALLRENQEG